MLRKRKKIKEKGRRIELHIFSGLSWRRENSWPGWIRFFQQSAFFIGNKGLVSWNQKWSETYSSSKFFFLATEQGVMNYGFRIHFDEFLCVLTICLKHSNFSLHYANISVGTPSLWFLVALDTGSDLFWLPCDCTSCIQGLRTGSGSVCSFIWV